MSDHPDPPDQTLEPAPAGTLGALPRAPPLGSDRLVPVGLVLLLTG